MKNSQYFPFVVTELIKNDIVKSVKHRKGLFSFVIEEVKTSKFYMIVQLDSLKKYENWLYKVEIGKDDFYKLEVGRVVNCHLQFEHEFTSFHHKDERTIDVVLIKRGDK